MNQPWTWLVAGLLAVLPAWAGAQTMYRCGNTFSQKPCGEGAAVKVPGAEVTQSASGSTPEAACTRAALGSGASRRHQVDGVEFGGTDVIRYANNPVAAKLYRVTLTEKSEDGRSLGQLSVTCYMSEDGQRVLRVIR